jgi:endonuclease/exonuclease/phosphatase family metal-dependent hydrolase
MWRPAILTALLAWTLMVPASGQSPAPPTQIRALTYNIHHGEGMDGIFDLARVAEVLMRERPDLIALQEVDQATLRSSGVKQANELARLTGMHVAFGKAMDYQGGEYGVAVLSRWPFAGTLNQGLPQAGDNEPRTILTVDVLVGPQAQRVRFSTTHFDQGRESPNRLIQAERLNQLLAADRTPRLLAGDLNSRVDTDVMEKIRSLWTDLFVEVPPPGAERPRYRVDYVMARPANRWRLIESHLIDVPDVSDHRPILAVVELIEGD